MCLMTRRAPVHYVVDDMASVYDVPLRAGRDAVLHRADGGGAGDGGAWQMLPATSLSVPATSLALHATS